MADRDKAENEEELDGADPEKRAEERVSIRTLSSGVLLPLTGTSFSKQLYN